MRIKGPLVAAIVILAAPFAAGCGGGDGGQQTTARQPTTSAGTKPTQPAATDHALTIRMTEFAFQPKDPVANAGKVTITARNDGKTVHEVVLLKTDKNPAKLPKKSGKVDESTSVGEIADVEPGSTKKATFKLAPGKYAMVCGLPGHYEGGMYGSLTVK